EVDYKDLEKGKIRVPVYRSLYLNKLLENVKNVEIQKDKEYKEIVNNIDEREYDDEITPPAGLNCTLRYYQKVGYKWLKILDDYRLGGILADDMGLGKTVQLISLLLDYKANAKVKLPSIVITPSSLALNWKSEIEKFAKDIKVLVIRGTSEEREKQIKQIPEFDLVITSYDLLKRDMEIYRREDILFKFQIADEAQYIKNSNTQNAKSLKTINAQTKYALTGTPIENSLAELWSIFDYIMPGYLFTYKKFKQLYEIPIMRDNDQEAMEKLKMMIEPFVLRRVKKDVLKELPEKSITVLNNEMQGEQLEIYLSYLAQAKKEAMTEIEGNGFEKSQIKILALLTRLRQICCHPSLFLENYMGESSKLTQCIEIVKDAIAGKHKILIFSGYTSMLNIIEGNLAKEGISYYKLTGQTKVDERVKLVNDFNNNPDVKVFLISLKAGGTGLNLIGADMVIHYDPWWNMSAENQATDRAYRIGQKNNVQVYKLITKNSIEEKIYELQEKKSKLIDNMLSTQTTFINKLNKDDIMELFN
uniref:SNF2-related protein n=1 Tax=Candidatus Merdicola sp. TaxID=3085652 RepID=UPI003FEEFE8D